MDHNQELYHIRHCILELELVRDARKLPYPWRDDLRQALNVALDRLRVVESKICQYAPTNSV